MEDMVSLRVIAKDEYPVSHTFCWGTVWVLSPRNNSFSTIVIQLTAWCYPGQALWMAWHASLNRCLRERT